MKKIFVIIFLTTTCLLHAQGNMYIGNHKVFTDSSNQLTIKYLTRLIDQETYFGPGNADVIFNLALLSSFGKFTVKTTAGNELLEFDSDAGSAGEWDFKYPITLNGVPFTTGGGDAFLGNAQTFTRLNTFDSLSSTHDITLSDGRGLSWSNPSSIKSITGALTYKSSSHNFNTQYGTNLFAIDSLNGLQSYKNLNFTNGLRARIGTSDNYGLALKTADTIRLEIDSLGKTTMRKRLDVLGAVTIAGDLEIGGGIGLDGDISSLSGNISAYDINAYGDFSGSGSLISDLNASNISSGTLDTARLNSKVTTSDRVQTLTNKTISGSSNTITNLNGSNISTGTVDTARLDSKVTTSDRVQTLTNKTISATSNTISNQTTGYLAFGVGFNSPVDGTTYYFGNTGNYSGNTAFGKISFFANCTIDAIVLNLSVATTLGTNENSVFTVLKNGTTTIDTITTAGKFDASSSSYMRTGLSYAITAGDYFQIKWVCPTWFTNPVNATATGYIHFK